MWRAKVRCESGLKLTIYHHDLVALAKLLDKLQTSTKVIDYRIRKEQRDGI